MRWLAKRFQYTKELRAKVREQEQCIHALSIIKNTLEGVVSDWEETETTFSRMTLVELETVLTACVDYQDILRRLQAGDPVQHRIEPIFHKYHISFERNTVVDEVIEEAKRYAENYRGRD